MNSRSLPQNKPLFGSDQLAKFVVFAHKSVSTIQVLSSQIEGIIMMRRPRGIGWHLETAVGMAKYGGTMSWSHDLCTNDHCRQWRCLGGWEARANHFGPLWSQRDDTCHCRHTVDGQSRLAEKKERKIAPREWESERRDMGRKDGAIGWEREIGTSWKKGPWVGSSEYCRSWVRGKPENGRRMGSGRERRWGG